MEFPYFDLKTAREILPWVKGKIMELRQAEINAQRALIDGKKEFIQSYTIKMDSILKELTEKGVIVRDIRMGLVDFPAVINDRPAYLCWKTDEDDIIYWHYTEEGFRGRKMITDKDVILSYQ
ncbi:MAG: DUF2203 domain-containing protein [Metallosphaera sp.]|uniref:DUF2203 domain-containing protein n=1 Tax=Metallosphaera cuprina (strain Ar-4) TaxID=1006006 RepID=F4G3J3_METCR|nr:DUF2203 domain-containing protein [Metallosphaera cuprina]AEB95363.1 conserved hypothetical protein [Metallosphaera cuprina Ar-4]